MVKIIKTIKAILTRILFVIHSLTSVFAAYIFQNREKGYVFPLTVFKVLLTPLIVLIFEGIVTLSIKENQEWKGFVFV